MAKKQKEGTPNINATPNRDIIQRLNFLYQASVYLQSLEPSTSSSIPISNQPSACAFGKSRSKSTQRTSGNLEKKKRRRKYTTSDLARNYVQCMRIVGQKTTVKMYELEEDFPYVIRVSLLTAFSHFEKRSSIKTYSVFFMQHDSYPRFISISTCEKYVFHQFILMDRT